jgi:hypothetical protein
MIISDCACGSTVPVNIVGSPGIPGTPGASGAIVLLGYLKCDFKSLAVQSIPIISSKYAITEVIMLPLDYPLGGSLGGVYTGQAGVGALATFDFTTATFNSTQWFSMDLQSNATSGSDVLTGSYLYLILTQPAAASSATVMVNVYGYTFL